MKSIKFFNSKVLVGISVAVVALAFLFLVENSQAENSVYEGPPKAVIIDQLYSDIPSENFQMKATQYLMDAGYEVDIFTTEQITVDFFKQLPTMNYNFIIFRTHGAADLSDDNVVTLFTGEKYTEEKYIQEQLFGLVKKGAPFAAVNYSLDKYESEDWVKLNDTAFTITTPAQRDTITENDYFLIPPKLVSEAMVGKFPSSTILLGGCSTMINTSMAKALVARGASTVVGWDNAVGSLDNDETMLMVLQKTLVEGQTIEDAIDSVSEEREWFNQYYSANFVSYSESSL